MLKSYDPVKVYYINTEDNGYVPTFKDSHVTFLSIGSCIAWGDLIHNIGTQFLYAQLCSPFSDGPFHACIVATIDDIHKKFKPEDDDTTFEVIDQIINALHEPDKGIILSLYNIPHNNINVNFKDKAIEGGRSDNINFPWRTDCFWPFKKQFRYNGAESNYISLHLTEENSWAEKKEYNRSIEEKMMKVLKLYNFNIKPISYSTNFSKVLDTVINSKVFLTYDGGGTTVAQSSGTPHMSWGIWHKENRYAPAGQSGSAGPWSKGQLLTYYPEDDYFDKGDFNPLLVITEKETYSDILNIANYISDNMSNSK